MKKSLFSILIAFLFVLGCQSGGSESSDTKQSEQLETAPAPPAQDDGSTQQVNPPHGQPGHVHGADEAAAPATQSTSPDAGAPATAGEVKLNPPHGEPGHRCDIPVGQPLP